MQDPTGLTLPNTKHHWLPEPTKGDEAYGHYWTWWYCDKCNLKTVVKQGTNPNDAHKFPPCPSKPTF